MFKSLSFVEAHEFLESCHACVKLMGGYLGGAAMEVISDAVNLYVNNTEAHGCPEDHDIAILFATAMTMENYNYLKKEYDATKPLFKMVKQVEFTENA